MAVATFGAGCFWKPEYLFSKIDGVTETAVGYMGGSVENPLYEQVCTDRTGHAEVVEVTFDPAAISYENLLDVFWKIHDPTQVNRQGPDVGGQYRSVIFCHSPEQEAVANRSKAGLKASGQVGGSIATSIEPAPFFWRAEDFHQQYYKKDRSSCYGG